MAIQIGSNGHNASYCCRALSKLLWRIFLAEMKRIVSNLKFRLLLRCLRTTKSDLERSGSRVCCLILNMIDWSRVCTSVEVSMEVYVEAFPWKIRTSQNEAKTKLIYRQLDPFPPLPSPPLSSTHTHPHTPRKSTSPAEFLVFHY